MSDHSQQFVLCVSKAELLIDKLVRGGEETCWFKPELLEAARGQLHFYRRDLAEADESRVQIIPYVVLMSYQQDKLHWFTYWRQQAASEQRLAGKRSVGLGGHIDIEDVKLDELPLPSGDEFPLHKFTTLPTQSVLLGAAIRELSEEVGVAVPRSLLQPVAAFYHHGDAVGRVHLGVLFTHIVNPALVHPGDELFDYAWEPLEKLAFTEAGLYEFETWSRLVIKRYANGISAICY